MSNYPLNPKLRSGDHAALNDSHIDAAVGSLLASVVVQSNASAAGVRRALLRSLESAGVIAIVPGLHRAEETT